MGTSVIGSTATSGTTTAQDRDPSGYDRPRVIEENGVEITLWDCSRGIIDSSQEIAQILVHVFYTGISQPEGITDTVSGTINVVNFDLPVDIRVNDHLQEFDPVDGSVTIESVNVYNSLRERTRETVDQGRLASIMWPQTEWECSEVMGMVPPDAIIREPNEIPYSYEVEPY